ncbi:hypothetical protein ACHAW5_001172 [Stephanodiscus triporus]|uniref:glutathione gamma-glutamylcysteinyltransferase n=1 Tax=Stephanodiscus triporus TaxID=2934178 RepID=A0ABD3MRE8_9STRA
MRGYQSIPSASSLDGIENGVPPPPPPESESERGHSAVGGSPPSSSSSSWMTPPVSRCANVFALVSLGIVVGGCIGSRAGIISRRDDDDDGRVVDGGMTTRRPFGAESPPLLGTARRRRGDFLINGKSFFDSLPFEEVVPRVPSRPWGEEVEVEVEASSRLRAVGLDDALSAAARSSIEEEEEEGEGGGTNVAILGAAASSSSSSSSGSPAPPTPHILYHATQTAFGLLYDPARSAYSLDYFLINSGGFDAQMNQAYCAVASVSTLLNSLKYSKRFREGDDLSGWSFDLPIDARYDPYPYATQEDVLAGDCVWDNVVERGDGSGIGGPRGGDVDGIFRPPYGLSLEQAGKLLDCHTSSEWVVTVQNVDPERIALPRVRYDLKAALIDPDARVMVNYDRKGLGQAGGGHFSPLGAYHVATDSFLVLDVAKYKYPPVWVGADTLFGAMATVDRCGTYDYPRGQERLNDDGGASVADGKANKLFDPITKEDFENSLKALNCKERTRGYIILKKKGSVSS